MTPFLAQRRYWSRSRRRSNAQDKSKGEKRSSDSLTEPLPEGEGPEVTPSPPSERPNPRDRLPAGRGALPGCAARPRLRALLRNADCAGGLGWVVIQVNTSSQPGAARPTRMCVSSAAWRQGETRASRGRNFHIVSGNFLGVYSDCRRSEKAKQNGLRQLRVAPQHLASAGAADRDRRRHGSGLGRLLDHRPQRRGWTVLPSR